MARVTVEDCIDKVESPYELVLVAKERATQLNAGMEPTLERDNDKHTVIALREIASDKIKVSDLEDSAVHKLRKHFANSVVPLMPINADLLMKKYKISEGKRLGEKLKIIEEEWVKNNFKISDQKIDNIINN